MGSLSGLETEILINLYKYLSNILKKEIENGSESTNLYTIERIASYLNSTWVALCEKGFTEKDLQNRLNEKVEFNIEDRCMDCLQYLEQEKNNDNRKVDLKNQYSFEINLKRRTWSFNNVQIQVRGKNGLTLHFFHILYVIASNAGPATPEDLYNKARELGLKVPEQESEINEIHYAVRKALRYAAKQNPDKISEQEIMDLFLNLGDGRTQLNIPPEEILLIDEAGEVS